MPPGRSNRGFSRADKVRKAMLRECSDIIARKIKDPMLSALLISVTDIELSSDLRYAKIFISVMGDEEARTNAMAARQEQLPIISSEIGRRIQLRYTPELELRYDDSLERGSRVTELLDQIARGEV